ncbi:SMI1/KNR4 family protein [Luteimonas deserti]|uniref:SMI1/KNR4 family protein n=1 Tax=Luteimonas deserti TaxID=2752306 RepID=A0A7Z0QUT7_9GAMM|nr:SMI1/KNR4 family protein [Luteimonas deserti]NYZ63430.1 SMI1/KNR4 family protein [Luteimonas deserti]
MPIDLASFWAENYYNHPRLTDEMVAVAESRLEVRLPTEFLALLQRQNGGYTAGFAHPMAQPTSWAKGHVPLHDLFGIVTEPEHETAQNLLSTEYMTQEWGLPPKQVLLSGDGHYWITLDYRAGDSPSVAWIDAECDEDMQIAPSFAAFLAGLVPDTTYEA